MVKAYRAESISLKLKYSIGNMIIIEVEDIDLYQRFLIELSLIK